MVFPAADIWIGSRTLEMKRRQCMTRLDLGTLANATTEIYQFSSYLDAGNSPQYSPLDWRKDVEVERGIF